MTHTTITPKYRTRKNPRNGTLDVQAQATTGLWHHIGSVRQQSLVPDRHGAWEASYGGVVLGHFAVKRLAVQSIVTADDATS